MAPEIINGTKYDEKVDIWSIAVISFMLLTGRVPYSTDPPNKERLKALIAKKQPNWEKDYFK
jgi:serine/threonine protein kinase